MRTRSAVVGPSVVAAVMWCSFYSGPLRLEVVQVRWLTIG
ncbi:hypothetical protein RHCRD62_70273 [Rhodococcus sp. RD6.2]|nr:hypothetical protein RHCRD62_70273 [Rhodococcus sp. RD6.2]